MISKIIILLSFLINASLAGPAVAVVCASGCNAAAVACYAAGGLTMGTITLGLGAPLAAIACSAAQGVCMAACAAMVATPTP